MTKVLWGIVIALVLSNPANAAWVNSKIRYVYPQADGSFSLVFEDPNPACTNPDKYFLVRVGDNGVTEQGVKHLYAAALSAASTGRLVEVFFDETSNLCPINRLLAKFS